MARPLLLFALFFVSGLCGLLYQVVWLRLAFADFGVITPVLSVVISVFMAGLSLGSWLGGRVIATWTQRTGRSAISFYGVAEILIGVGAFAVPYLFDASERLLRPTGEIASLTYLIASGLAISLSLLPWTFFMGTTFPFMTAYIKEQGADDESGFSFLYLANVAGATFGVLLTALVLIELLGFSRTLALAGTLNFAVGGASLWVGTRATPRLPRATAGPAAVARRLHPLPFGPLTIFALLFGTGFTSMAMEVVWTRAFTPIVGTTIYAFAGLLAVYLASTWLGTGVHRALQRRGRPLPYELVLPLLASAALLPLLLPDPRLAPVTVVAFASIVPFCAGLGYLTPRLMDEYSRGRPELVGRGYAINILGSILGPLFAGYVLLPAAGSKGSLVVLAAPFLLLSIPAVRRPAAGRPGAALLASSLLLFGFVAFESRTFEDGRLYGEAEVRRDHTATVISYREDGEPKLLVNGFGITVWTPITKMMAHLPLAARETPAEQALVICFGMGTTLRSVSSWGVPVTAVELVPSVVDAFGYYFDDAEQVLARPGVEIVTDDGRRFLKRTTRTFDVVTIDPPPPPETAGSSLLYSQEFYELLKGRMSDDAILHQWFPGAEPEALAAVTSALLRAFISVRIFRSFEGWGFHFLASQQPLPELTAEGLLARLPEGARRDLEEWRPASDVPGLFETTLALELPPRRILRGHSTAWISDDRPINEYYFLRRLGRDS
jgi:spermidine synthase